MKKFILFPALLLSLLASGQEAWRQGLKYRLQVKLDDKQKTLEGSMDLRYTNHSPDTLHFIWFHVWPNAYRNDRTGYSEQLLENGKTGFYFSDKESKGYINRLEFRVNGIMADIQDHPEYIDVIKLILPAALAPGDSIRVDASFHEKLPYNFSGYGFRGHNFQVSNWYPEPAVYDREGWHTMPFLEQGGAYHEAADYEVGIDVPDTYTLAAGNSADTVLRQDNSDIKTYRFSLRKANSFAWIAGQRLTEKKDTVQLETGKQIRLNMYYFRRDSSLMQDQLGLSKSYIRQLSSLVSEYPYSSLTLIETLQPQEQSFSGMILMDVPGLYKNPERILRRALAAQWFQAICLSDERLNPWMSGGFIRYYDQRLQPNPTPSRYQKHRVLDDRIWLRVAEREKTAQPIRTPAEKMSPENYSLIAGTKSALWIKSLEDSLGEIKFDRGMRSYFEKWKFGHPGPEDYKAAMEESGGIHLDSEFEELNTTRSLFPAGPKKMLKPAYGFSRINQDKYNYINIAPAFGYNRYDDFMIGAIVHNYTL
ncbi:MAG TPA: M1 family metallopeptidase, partial [Puia sp.]